MSKVTLFHRVKRKEGFEESAQALFQLVQNAQKAQPNQERHMYLEITGHRNEEGGYDSDMFEFHRHFILEFLLHYLTYVVMPLCEIRNLQPQNNELPDKLETYEEGSLPQ